MQCSGIHRGLGVHISQVRSTTLDTWQPDQVLRMGQVGNARSNAKYEARLPAGFKRPSHVRDGQGAVRRFIEQKYVQKKWFRDDEPAAAADATAAAAAEEDELLTCNGTSNRAAVSIISGFAPAPAAPDPIKAVGCC